MNGIRAAIAAAAALALPGVAVAGANPVPHQFCQVQFVAGGPLYDGIGITVGGPHGAMSVCRVRVPPPPATIVMKFPDANGDTVVITRSGVAIAVFH
ncbi:MAG: hypothetical protein QOG06_2858 [Gaiellaceae bacterium]|jgi:hypothetical protein|nr:hypothetical protein [Gaiellaceae bacterium]